MTIDQALSKFESIRSWKTAGNDVQYYIECDENNKVIVVFQGSNSTSDWIHNFCFWKKPYKNMEVPFRVHSGFLKYWKSCEDIIGEEVASYNPSSIVIIGHSLGGACATLAMEYFDFHYRKDNPNFSLECITFGAPRVLGLLHYKKVKDRWKGTKLVNNGSDIVPCVPPYIFFYKHVTEQIHIGELRHLINFFKPAKYHNISNYRESLNKIIK